LNKKEFIEYHRECLELMHRTMLSKNADYTADSSDPFSNFSTVEQLDICSTEQGFLVRLNDKFARIRAFVKNKNLLVKEEGVEDTLLDMSNYCILMAGYLKSKRLKA
jgi:hypothetical protein